MAGSDGTRARRATTLGTIIALLASTMVLASPSAEADTLTVCGSGCDHTTIQGAIGAAQAGDTIQVASGVYSERIVVSTSVSIVGAGSSATAIDGTDSGTVVTVPPGVIVTIQDLLITGGLATDGAGVRNEGDLTLHRVEVSGNVATDPSSVADGGGIATFGVLAMTETVVSLNTADRGGGIWNQDGAVLLVDSSVTSNTARSHGGGGIANWGTAAVLEVLRSSVSQNSVTVPGTDQRGGGGIWSQFGDVTVEDSTISDNESGYSSGGIYLSGSSADLAVTRSTVAGNRTGTDRGTGRGGGMSVRSSSRTTITESTITGNVSASSGGGIHADASLQVENSTISGNQATSAGGGIDADIDPTLSSVTVAGNTADFGGGVYAFGQTVLADNTVIADNTATDTGHDCYGTISVPAGSAALVEDIDPAVCSASGSGTLLTGVDPQLGPLADNGGPTLTHLPADGSPAIDAGATDLGVDQRGEPRPSGSGDDLGAVEVQVILGAIELTPDWGGLDTWIEVRAVPTDGTDCGWSAGEDVVVAWGATPLDTFTANAQGCFAELVYLDGTELLAGSSPGPHKVTAEGEASGVIAQTAFEQVVPQLHPLPVEGASGSPVELSGCGWGGATAVNVFFLDTGELIGKGTVDASGCFAASGQIPAVVEGTYVLGATPDSVPPSGPGGSSAAAYRVRPASFSISPTQGPPGVEVDVVDGCSWFPGEQVEFTWNPTGEVIGILDTRASGCVEPPSLAPSLQIPTSAADGTHDIVATGLDSRQTARQPFTVVGAELIFDPSTAEPDEVVAASGCGWNGNGSVLLEWGATDPNNRNPSWLATVDPLTGCFGDGDSFTFVVPDDTTAGDVTVTATGNVSGETQAVFTVIHPGEITLGASQAGLGDVVSVQVTDAIIGETIDFRWGSIAGDVIGFGGAATRDFTTDVTIPLDAAAGPGEVLADGSKGFLDTAGITILDESAVAVLSQAPYFPGDVIEVEGSGFAVGTTVTLRLVAADGTRQTLGTVPVEGDTTFSTDVHLPDDSEAGTYTLVASGLSREATVPLTVTGFAFTIDASLADPAPDLDGVLATDEWDYSRRIPFGSGNVYVSSDDNRLYVLVDVLADTGDDPIGSGDTVWLSFDLDGDGVADPGDDLNFRVDSSGDLILEEYSGPASFDLRNSAFLTSAYAAGFGCFVADSTFTFSLTGGITCDSHRVWEIGIDLQAIDAQPGDVIRMGVRTDSASPAFSDGVPTLPDDFAELGRVSLAPSQLPASPPTGTVTDIGSGGFEIEVTQATQDQDNDVHLVTGKDTAVRVYPAVDAEALVRVYLYGERNGIDLPGSPLVTLATIPATIDRELAEHTANFLMPASWTEAGVTDLIARVEQLDGTNPTLDTAGVVFTTRNQPVVWAVPINAGTAASPDLISESTISTQLDYLEAVYPLPGVEWVRQSWTVIGEEVAQDTDDDGDDFTNLNVVLDELNQYYNDTLIAYSQSTDPGFRLPDQIYGFTSDGGGLADAVWGGGSGKVAAGFWGTSREGTLAHEINHNLDGSSTGSWGRHVTNPSDNTDADWGCDAGGPDGSWPGSDDEIGEVGFDTRRPWVEGEGSPRTVVPSNYPDFMSYCQSEDEANGESNQRPTKWISPYRWQALFADLAAVSAQTQTLSIAATSSSAGDVYYVSGQLAADGSGSLDPIETQPGVPTPVIVPGDYTLEIRDAAGEVLASHPFTASFVDVEGEARDTVYFHYRLPTQAGAAAVALTRDGVLLDEIAASESVPVVEVTSPSGGEVWSGQETITWTASDADGDPLTFSILYSPDGGGSWFPVASDLTATSHTIDVDRLPGGEGGQILVVATDGFHTVEGRSAGTFTVPEPGPTVTILSPRDLQVIESGARVELRGTAVGVTGARLADDRLVWLVDGEPVGSGPATSLVPADGDRQVTLLAIGDGVVGEDTITLRIGAEDLPPVITAATVAPSPVAMGSPVTLEAAFSADPSDFVAVEVDWGDGTTTTVDPATSPLAATHRYQAAGLYEVTVTAADEDGDADTAPAGTVVVYDPDAGISLAGWVDSPADGAVFVQSTGRYVSGDETPGGTSRLRLVSGFELESIGHDWLVVTSDDRVVLRGTGRVDGELAPTGDPYRFQIWATDGAPDTLRVRVWHGDVVVLDTGVERPLKVGELTIQRTGTGSAR